MRHISPKDAADLDATETREWLDSLDYVLQSGGPAKVARLLRELTLYARKSGVKLPFTANTPIFLVGDLALASRYARALAIAGFAQAQPLDGERAAARGLWRIAQEQAA